MDGLQVPPELILEPSNHPRLTLGPEERTQAIRTKPYALLVSQVCRRRRDGNIDALSCYGRLLERRAELLNV